MTALDLFLIAFLFLLVGGFHQAAERCRDLLDFLRPQPEPMAAPQPRSFHVPPNTSNVAEPTLDGATMPPPPEPEFAPWLYPNLYEQDTNGQWRARSMNPDHTVKSTDKELGGITSHIPERDEDE